MIIPFDKLFTLNTNRYIFSRACMKTVEKIGNIKTYPEDETNWKVVPNILKLMLDSKVQYDYLGDIEAPESTEE